MRTNFNIRDDYLDSRNLIDRLEELEAKDNLDEDELKERDAIRTLSEQGIEDWQYGAQLIREDYFTDYAQQLAEGIGAIDPNASWPLNYIDWDAAAEALKQDYSTVEILGTTYYVR